MAKKMTFEESKAKLEQIVEELEAGDLPLEKALKKFEEGVRLSKECFDKLDETEKKISILLNDQNGNVIKTPFLSDAEDGKKKTSKVMGSQTPDQFDLFRYLDNKRDLINRSLLQIIDENFSDCRLCHAMKYSLMAPGKRLRPVLCLAAAETIGTIDSNIIAAACGIEMIHTYSLIHDDLPAMDNDNVRRGKPTCHIKFDVATAILAGDALLTLAFEIFSSMKLRPNENSGTWIQIINNIAKAAGHRGMIEGQMRDIAAENNELDLNELQKMHHLKTGALIEASVTTGALLGGGSTASIKQLEIYAANIGLAFQVADDILNVEGDPLKMGKATGTDQLRNKSTYPGLLGLSQSKQFAFELVNNALQALEIFGNKANPLSALAKYIIERKR